MALAEKITCDQCGIVKGPANHWILWHKVGEPGTFIYFSPWDDDYTFKGHLCGESCAGKMLSKSIEEWGKRNGED